MTTFTVRVKLRDNFQEFTVDQSISLDELVKMISSKFKEDTSNKILSYQDEDNDLICVYSNEELVEAFRVASYKSPSILNITLLPKGQENFPQTSLVGSNWAKKSLEEEKSKNNLDRQHVVKISGVPFNSQKKENLNVKTTTFQTSMTPTIQTSMAPPSVPKKKTIKETVETLSEEQKNITEKLSEVIKEKTIQYSNQILEGTNPLSQTIYESSLSRSELLSNQLSQSENNVIPVNYNELVDFSSKLDEYSTNTYNDVQQLSIGTNERNISINSDISTKCLDIAEGARLIVDEKSEQVINEMDLIRSKVNTDVNIGMTGEINVSTVDIESKMESLSTKTSENMNIISDNIVKNILSI